MKKYLFIGGVIGGMPTVILILLNYLTTSDTDIFYMLLWISSIPATVLLYPLEGIIPRFGIMGMGDVFGFIYLSYAIATAVIYSIIGIFIGWLIFKIKIKIKNRNTSPQNRF